MADPTGRVSDFYAGKSIFITGATGFVGKVLVEKLLRSCPDVKRIYLLLRQKKGQSVKERLDDFINSRVFDILHKTSKHSFEKLRVVPGDILLDKLGLSDADRNEIHNECNIVFHSAACVRFDSPLRTALFMNTLGTKKVLELAEGIKNLAVFIHISTAYSRCDIEILEEKVYRSNHKPQNVVDTVTWMEDDLVEHLQTKLIDPQPNTYAYTKSLTEDLVSQWAEKFPIAVARPSIVTAAYKEPIPGWVDNLNGPTGLIAGAGKGVIRTMLCNENFLADVVPVDIVVNGCIILAYTTATEQSKQIKVCNITESGANPITWGRAIEFGRELVHKYPFSITLWYPGGNIRTNYVQHMVALFFTHTVPAYLIDMLMLLLGKKTFMLKVQQRVNYGLEVLQYYTTKQWYFKNDNFLTLRDKITKEDNEIFYTDLKVIDWYSYLKDYLLGIREFCMKEDPANLPQARKSIRRLYVLDRVAQLIMYLVLAYFAYYYLKIIFSKIDAYINC